MAYDFVAASTQYLSTTTTPVTGTPLTLACWFYKDLSLNTRLVDLVDTTNGSSFQIRANIGSAVSARVGALAADQSAVGTQVLDQWRHAAGVFTSSTSRTAYVDGTAGTANTANVTPSDADFIMIGAGNSTTSPLTPHDGRIADVGIWNVALTAAEISALAKGAACNLVRPQSLVFYAPLIRNLQDVRDGRTITNTNAATVANHPRIYQ
jgi:hypothetical protein